MEEIKTTFKKVIEKKIANIFILILLFLFGVFCLYVATPKKIGYYKGQEYIYGYINKAGKEIITPQFHLAEDLHDVWHLHVVRFINKQGKFIIKPHFYSVSDYKEILALIGMKKELYDNKF